MESRKMKQRKMVANIDLSKFQQLPVAMVMEILSRLSIKTLVNCSLQIVEVTLCMCASNPILGEFITIPPNHKGRYRAPLDGFGFSVETNQYKVLQSFYPIDARCRSIDYLEVEIYTIGTGVWRSIGNAPSGFLKFPSLQCSSPWSLHWVSLTVESAECIHSFSFETEQFRSLPLPSNYGRVKREFHDLLKLGVLGGCLVLCVFGGGASRELDMWVMKDYGSKILVLEDLYMKDVSCYYTEPVMIFIDGKILMAFNGWDVVFHNQEIKSLGKSRITPTGSAFDATSYSPCFVPLSEVFKEEEVNRVRGSKKSDKLLAEGSYRYELKLTPTIETACAMCGEQLGYVFRGLGFPMCQQCFGSKFLLGVLQLLV